jgi:hypothetical protein
VRPRGSTDIPSRQYAVNYKEVILFTEVLAGATRGFRHDIHDAPAGALTGSDDSS